MTHRVLQVIPEMDIGGAERTCLEVATALVTAGHMAHVATTGGGMVPALEQAGAAVHIRNVKTKNPLAIIRNAFWLAALIRKNQITLIHARSRAPAWSAWWASRMTGIPYLATYHGTYKAKGKVKRTYNAVMTKGPITIANSQFIKDHILAEHDILPEQIIVIPRGADLNQFDPEKMETGRIKNLESQCNIPDNTNIILLPARLTSWKGQSVLIEALANITWPFTALLVGDHQGRDEYKKDLINQIHNLNLQDRVHLVGPCDDMPAAYALADVVVSPATEPEAFGRVAIEAQAMTKPIIASSHGGHLETVIPNQTGWLTTPNDPLALAAALDDWHAMAHNERQEMGLAGQRHVRENFSTASMTTKTLNVYSRLDPL